ncbi:protein NRT1/ PTR FAMILY 8.3-like isoform X1 [Triticum dicoccoides]|uniref:protein NRT1/ PTR FAMILY 8.3-like isoform X1 n=1 Tax=Triticum dicoccoides TaxID=85692 RepID=UPI001890576C|nr:protein NRT1/ PTR FAMILY 8.3-like isoform X1 [Triticum dicoccoides]
MDGAKAHGPAPPARPRPPLTDEMASSAGNGKEMAALESGHGSSSSSSSSPAAAAKMTAVAGKPRPFTWTGPAIVMGFELLESIAFSGVALNLVIYLGTVLHGTTAFNAAHVDTWNGTTFIVPVLGAFLADSCWGKYNTIVVSLLFYLAGLVLLTLSAAISPFRPSSCQGLSCPPASRTQFSVFFAALYLTSIGTGGVKSALLPFGAEQYDDSSPEESRRKQSFFTWFFGAINLGIFVAGTLVSWLQQNVSWALGFGVSALCLLLAAAGFLAGTPWYRVQLPAGSPLRDILRVVVASVKKRKTRLPAAAGQGDLGLHEVAEDDDLQKLAHTKGLRCLDKAAAKGGDGREGPWNLCTVSEVEAVKILARMVPIWVTCVLYAASLGQMTTTFIQQGMTMDNKLLGKVKVPVASMVSIEVVFMLLWVLLHDAVIMPLARRWGRAGSAGLSQLQRMGVGRVLVVLAMATAALVESRRLHVAGAGRKMGIAWQVPQFVLVAGSDVFCGIAQLEFFYGEAPASMRSICSAFSFLALSLGFYVNSVVVTAVAALRPGWLARDLNEGHLDYYFWLWAVISAGNLLLYLLLAAQYTPKQVLRHSP